MNLPNHQLTNFHVISLPERVGQKQTDLVWGEVKPLLHQSECYVLLDMTKIRRLDWSGVTFLMELFSQMRRYSGTLAMMHVHPVVMAFLELTQTNQLIPVFQDEQAALAGLKD